MVWIKREGDDDKSRGVWDWKYLWAIGHGYDDSRDNWALTFGSFYSILIFNDDDVDLLGFGLFFRIFLDAISVWYFD